MNNHKTKRMSNPEELLYLSPYKYYNNFETLKARYDYNEEITLKKLGEKMKARAEKLGISSSPMNFAAFFFAHFTVNITAAWSIAAAATNANIEEIERRCFRDAHWDLAFHAIKEAISHEDLKRLGLQAWDEALGEIERCKGRDINSWDDIDSGTFTLSIIKNDAIKEVSLLLGKIQHKNGLSLTAAVAKLSNLYVLNFLAEDNIIENRLFEKAYDKAQQVFSKHGRDRSIYCMQKIIRILWKNKELMNNVHVRFLINMLNGIKPVVLSNK
jgi:hypothetical protein